MIKPGKYPDKTAFIVSENLLGDIASSKHLSKARKLFYSPIFRASDLNSAYRLLSNLEAVGLLPRKSKAGWRKLDWSEYIYVLIVVELRKYGMKSEALRPFMKLWLNKENRVAEISMLTVLGGVEISLIFKPDGTCAILDPSHIGLYESEAVKGTGILPDRGVGEIQFKLSHFFNKLWVNIGLEPLEMRVFFGQQQQAERIINSLSEAEKEAVLKTRELAPNEKMTVRRGRANDVLFDTERNVEVDDNAAKLLVSLVGGDFGKLGGSIQNGKVVGIKATKSNKVQDN